MVGLISYLSIFSQHCLWLVSGRKTLSTAIYSSIVSIISIIDSSIKYSFINAVISSITAINSSINDL